MHGGSSTLHVSLLWFNENHLDGAKEECGGRLYNMVLGSMRRALSRLNLYTIQVFLS